MIRGRSGRTLLCWSLLLAQQTLSGASPLTPPAAAAMPARVVNNRLGLTFVRIPAGVFQMGSDAHEAYSDELPLHQVTISHAFYLATTPVTNAQWNAVMPRYGVRPFSEIPSEQDLPVLADWESAQRFCALLGTTGDPEYRLPTEAEWEYACRAGTTGVRYGPVDDIAWYDLNGGQHIHPVAQKRANPWGLFDMLGNVFQWCGDWYGDYPAVPVTDPKGPATGQERVCRGGSWNGGPRFLRASVRACFGPDFRQDDVGFRVVWDVADPRHPDRQREAGGERP